MQKALILTTTSGFLSQFELNNVKLLKERGFLVHYATNFGVPVYEVRDKTLRDMGVVLHHVSIEKSPFKLKKNVWALRELIRIIDREGIDAVHCHNPTGGLLGRLAAVMSGKRPFVIYTAHGFHFFKGAPLMNRLLYYPAEKFLARLTDILITVNREDYAKACTFRYRKGGGARLIPGVGVDTETFRPPGEAERAAAARLRREFGIPEGAFHVVLAGELNKNKNHGTVLEALALLSRDDVYCSICGEGPRRAVLEKRIRELGLSGRVSLRGYRNDMPAVWHTADASVFPSRREGMGMAALEAMACGVPLIAADNRGTREYMEDGVNGLVCGADAAEEFADALRRLREDGTLRETFAENARETVRAFTLERTEERMREIYDALPGRVPETEPPAEGAPLISVIMGVRLDGPRDTEAFGRAAESVLDQTLGDFEFLICDDGSPAEGAAACLAALEERDARVRVIRPGGNHGLGYALNRCIEKARGKYLARMDADDIATPERFAVEAEFLDTHPEYMWCGSGCRLFDADGVWGESERPEDPDVRDYLKYSPYIHPTVMYRASLFGPVAGYSEERRTRRCEDYEFFLRLFGLGYRGYNIRQPLLYYRADRKRYHARPLAERLRECGVRREGYRRLGIPAAEGIRYVLRPLAGAFVPGKMLIRHKKREAEPL